MAESIELNREWMQVAYIILYLKKETEKRG